MTVFMKFPWKKNCHNFMKKSKKTVDKNIAALYYAICVWQKSMTQQHARVAQLVEHDLAKVGAAGSSPVSRSHKTLYRCLATDNMREWLSWWSTTLPRSGPRVRVPSRALFFKGHPNGCPFCNKRVLPDSIVRGLRSASVRAKLAPAPIFKQVIFP